MDAPLESRAGNGHILIVPRWSTWNFTCHDTCEAGHRRHCRHLAFFFFFFFFSTLGGLGSCFPASKSAPTEQFSTYESFAFDKMDLSTCGRFTGQFNDENSEKWSSKL